MSGLFKNFFHICLFVKDVEASLDFYEKLGCERAFIMENNGEPWNYYLRLCKGQFIELQPVNGPNPHPHPEDCKYYYDQTVMHFSFETDNIAEAIDTLRSRGLTLYQNPEPDAPEVKSADDVNHSEDNCLSFWVKDPDGNPIEIMEQTQYSLQRLSEIRLDAEADR